MFHDVALDSSSAGSNQAERHESKLHAEISVAILEDDEIDARLLQLMLKQSWPGSKVTRHVLLSEIVAELERSAPTLVLSDLSVPDARGVEIVQKLRRVAPYSAIVVLTGDENPDTADCVLRAGAQDYLVKGKYDLDALSRAMRYSMARFDAEEALRKTSAALLQSNGELNQYAGIVAHDLRAPVRTARLLADRLVASQDHDSATTAKGRAGMSPIDLAGRLDSCLNRLEGLIDGLLRLSSLRDELLEPTSEPLAAVVADIRDDLHADIEASGASIVCHGDFWLRSDPVLTRELLRNLVENSIKYRSQDRPLVIEIDGLVNDTAVEITVCDNGIGIEPEYRDRVFRLFERLHGASSEIPGLGVGLALCQRIVSIHEGSISVQEPKDGVGTRVMFSFPRAVTGYPEGGSST